MNTVAIFKPINKFKSNRWSPLANPSVLKRNKAKRLLKATGLDWTVHYIFIRKKQLLFHLGSFSVVSSEFVTTMEEDKGVFYVVRKGDTIGVYNTFIDCQAQAGSSLFHPPMSVFKGYGLPKEAADFLALNGLRNAAYSINAANVKEDLFGKIVPYLPHQQPSPVEMSLEKNSPPKRLQEGFASKDCEAGGSALKNNLKLDAFIEPQALVHSVASGGLRVVSPNAIRNPLKVNSSGESQAMSSKCHSCILEFDGASKGNPGQAGAGAVICAEDGSKVYRLCEGVGLATNNVAEYRGLILGMKKALEKGFTKIHAKGDSYLVCMQVQGQWKTKHATMIDLCNEALELKNKFTSFQISHIAREFNSDADAQANRGVNLKDGIVEEVCSKK